MSLPELQPITDDPNQTGLMIVADPESVHQLDLHGHFGMYLEPTDTAKEVVLQQYCRNCPVFASCMPEMIKVSYLLILRKLSKIRGAMVHSKNCDLKNTVVPDEAFLFPVVSKGK